MFDSGENPDRVKQKRNFGKFSSLAFQNQPSMRIIKEIKFFFPLFIPRIDLIGFLVFPTNEQASQFQFLDFPLLIGCWR